MFWRLLWRLLALAAASTVDLVVCAALAALGHALRVGSHREAASQTASRGWSGAGASCRALLLQLAVACVPRQRHCQGDRSRQTPYGRRLRCAQRRRSPALLQLLQNGVFMTQQQMKQADRNKQPAAQGAGHPELARLDISVLMYRWSPRPTYTGWPGAGCELPRKSTCTWVMKNGQGVSLTSAQGAR